VVSIGMALYIEGHTNTHHLASSDHRSPGYPDALLSNADLPGLTHVFRLP